MLQHMEPWGASARRGSPERGPARRRRCAAAPRSPFRVAMCAVIFSANGDDRVESQPSTKLPSVANRGNKRKTNGGDLAAFDQDRQTLCPRPVLCGRFRGA